jgi:hypothetical protein
LDRSIIEQRGVLSRQKSLHENLIAIAFELSEIKWLQSVLVASILEVMRLFGRHLSKHVQNADPIHVDHTVLDLTQLHIITSCALIIALVTSFLDSQGRSEVSLQEFHRPLVEVRCLIRFDSVQG